MPLKSGLLDRAREDRVAPPPLPFTEGGRKGNSHVGKIISELHLEEVVLRGLMHERDNNCH